MSDLWRISAHLEYVGKTRRINYKVVFEIIKRGEV
jgi:hypothetical protein